MAFHYSQPFESLLEEARHLDSGGPVVARVVIVGSGYGGSVAAYRLAELARRREHRHHVIVLERGREYALGEFPTGLDELPGHLRVQRPDQPNPAGNQDALFDLHVGENVDVLVGSGLGGSSLINANVAIRPDARAFDRPPWPRRLRQEALAGQGQPLWTAFVEVERALDIETPTADQLTRKYSSLEAYARALRMSCERAPLAVRFASGRNRHGVEQSACTRCGNCVTGCNVGAKNTLAMNLIPAARARGVEFFSGALVTRVALAEGSANGARWSVTVRPTSSGTRARSAQDLTIEADIVILAAGTLGSTEILQRSRSSGLPLSSTLGSRFSTNGDAIAMSFAAREPVGAIGTANVPGNGDCGPTITGVVRGSVGRGELRDDFILEEGAIPVGLREVFGEIVTTGAQLGRLGKNELPGWLKDNPKADPLAVHEEALERSNVYLVMSHDDSNGSLRWAGAGQGESGWTVPAWPAPAAGASSTTLDAIDAKLRSQDRKRGLDHAQFVANPLWRPLPAEAGSALSGNLPGGRLITVHPLGGCPMADSGRTGVVNHVGQVYRGDWDALHEGLFVLDGSILPTSLGVNPFLTIAALAWRACDVILATFGSGSVRVQEPMQPRCSAIAPPAAGVLASPVVIRECLIGKLERPVPAEAEATLRQAGVWCDRWFEDGGLILHLETTPGAPDPQSYRDAVLKGSGKVPITARLYANPLLADEWKRLRLYHSPAAHLEGVTPVAQGGGSVSFLAVDAPSGVLERLERTIAALQAYFERRQRLADLLRTRRAGTPGSVLLDWLAHPVRNLQRLYRGARTFVAIAAMHADYRTFDYQLSLPLDGGGAITLQGSKRVRWRRGNDRVWQALLRLPVDLTVGSVGLKGCFDVDTRYMAGQGLLRIEAGPAGSVPHGLANVVAFAGRFARSILQAGFWEFGAPDYPEKSRLPERHPDLPPVIDGAPRESWELHVQRKRGAADSRVPLRLHRYRSREENHAGTILLVHGLAQGSLIYAHPAQGTSMAGYLLDCGYDVWLLDYRLSNQFDERQVPYDGWTIDEIAEFDVPAAVRFVLAESAPGTKLHVFAHCVGAVAMTMAVLRGWVTNQQLTSLVLNAIHPWIIGSPANQLRARVGVFARDYLSDEFFDPIPVDRESVSAMHSVLDRLAFSLARLGEEHEHPPPADRHLAGAICDRMTFLYGRMWLHDRSGGVHAYWKDLVGRAPGSVQRHLYYLVTHGRVLDHEGVNSYLTDANIRRWQGIRTLFLHGDRSDVFNPQSASRSAVRLVEALRRVDPAGITPVGLKRFEGYGHMDVILADSAREDCFPYVDAFVQGRFDNTPVHGKLHLDTPDDPHSSRKGTSAVGPILRGARIDGQGRLHLRAWVEMPAMITAPAPASAKLLTPPGATVSRLPTPPSVEPQYQWYDVVMDAGDYRTLEFGVHGDRIWGTFSALPSRLHRGAGPQLQPSWLTRMRRRVSQPSENTDCHFLVGSCLYPGTAFDREGPDKLFVVMDRLLDRVDCDALFLIGDQIYADATAGLLDPRAWRDRYFDRYRESFGRDPLRTILERVPVHFAIDDHEFADNYAGHVSRSAPLAGLPVFRSWLENWRARAAAAGIMGKEEFEFARAVARSYVGSGREIHSFDGAVPVPSPFWYALEHGNEFPFPTFVLDTRSERTRAPAGQRARLMTRTQLDALKGWLLQVKDLAQPKFIFSGSVVAPLARDSHAPGAWLREDGWAGYPVELGELVSHIVDHDIQHVVFVGGDLHLSCAAELTLSKNGKSVRALQVVSSGLYAPLPFANMSRNSIDWNVARTIPAGECTVQYTARLLSDSRSHFVQVSVRADTEQRSGVPGCSWTVELTAHDAHGGPGKPLRVAT